MRIYMCTAPGKKAGGAGVMYMRRATFGERGERMLHCRLCSVPQQTQVRTVHARITRRPGFKGHDTDLSATVSAGGRPGAHPPSVPSRIALYDYERKGRVNDRSRLSVLSFVYAAS
jgi:hypothetical protein